jgi:hypothetical protein
LESVEERKAFRNYIETKRVFDERSANELKFFALHGYFPEAGGGELPPRWEVVVGGIRTIVTTEWVASDQRCEGSPEVRLCAVGSQSRGE